MTRATVIKIFTLLAFVFGFSLTPTFAFAATNPALNSSGGPDTSLNWSGYVATNGTYTGVSGSWTVPSVTPSTSAQADATWIGISGVSSHDLIQVGTQTITQNGTVSYEAWYELLPADSIAVPLTVHAGDSITASLQEEQASQWQINIRDNTSGQSYATTVPYASSLSSAEWIEEMPSDQSGFIPLDSFGSVSFSNASAIENGNTVTPAQANAFPLTMITNAGQALAIPSALGADGASFTVSRSTAVSNIAPRTVRPDGRGGFRRGGSGASSVSTYQPHVQTPQPPQSFRIYRSFGFLHNQRFVQFLEIRY